MLLVRLECNITLLSQLLRALRVLLEQVVRLCESDKPFYQRAVVSDESLHPLYKREFHDVFDEFREHAEFEPLLQRMKVVDQNGETDMDEDQWEAASACLFSLPFLPFLPCADEDADIYVMFALEKREAGSRAGTG